MSILNEILSKKEIQETNRKRTAEIASISKAIQSANDDGKIALIAEIKPKSPSAGTLRDSIDIEKIALIYQENGASCISILTEKNYFGGQIDNVFKVSGCTNIPLFRKDFITDLQEIESSFHINADAILLMVSVLGKKTKRFLQKCQEIGIEAIVEVHSKEELTIALDANAKIIGINNRDLRTLTIDFAITQELIADIPRDRIIISESGFSSARDIENLASIGINAVLVGSQIMKSSNMAQTVKEMSSVCYHGQD